jgi:hypothetical protein
MEARQSCILDEHHGRITNQTSVQSEHTERLGLCHQSLVSTLIDTVSCPETEDRVNAQRKTMNYDQLVTVWRAEVLATRKTEEQDSVARAEAKYQSGMERSVAAWIGLSRFPLGDLCAWRNRLLTLEGEVGDDSSVQRSGVSVWR